MQGKTVIVGVLSVETIARSLSLYIFLHHVALLPSQRYIKLYKMMDRFDNHVADRYDHATGGHYLDIVEELYFDGWLSDKDIEKFDEEVRNETDQLKQFYKITLKKKE